MKKEQKDTPVFWLPQENAALSASAGSGKTYNLTWRLIAIMLYEQSLGNSLKNTFAVTFTNKATLDMKYKVIERLKKLAFPQYEKPDKADEEAIEYLSNILTGGDKELLLKKANEAYSNLLYNLSDLNISTIHSFLSGIVSLFPFEIGINPDNKIIDEVEREVLLKESFDIFLKNASQDNKLEDRILQTFDNLGYNSINVKNSIYGLIKEFFAREWEIKERYKPDFLEKELSETQKKLDSVYSLFNGALLKNSIEEILEIINKYNEFETINVRSFKDKIENMLGSTTLKKLTDFKKYFDNNSVEEIYGFKGFLKKLPDTPAAQLEDSFRYIKNVFEPNISPLAELTNRTIALNFISLFLQYLEIYEKRKRDIGALDFSDLEGLAYGLLGGTKFDREYFYFRIDTRIKHLLIDEFQDTSIIQWDILSPLVDEIVSGIGVHDDKGSFFYVGDKKQAIYRFRRGESGLFDMVKRKLNVNEYSLGKNFRCAKNIVDTVNDVFSKIMTHTKYVRQDPSVDIDGYVEIDASEDDEDTAQKTVETVKSLYEKGIKYSEIAILVRSYTNTPLIENLLKKGRIPYRNEQTASLSEAVEIKDVINLLRFLNNSEDDISLSCVLRSPLFRINDRTFEIIKSHKGITLYLKLKNSGIIKKVYKDLEELLNRVSFLSPLKLANQIYMQFNIYSLYSTINGAEENLKKFLEEVFIFQNNNSADIASFLDYFDLKRDAILQAEPDDNGSRGINIMSVHKAKGLEFHSVIIPFADFEIKLDSFRTKFIFSYDEEFNLSNIIKIPVNAEKELSGYLRNCYEDELKKVDIDEINLLYVAMTRAKENLFIIGKRNAKEKTWFFKLCSALELTIDKSDKCEPVYKIGEISGSAKISRKKPVNNVKASGGNFEFSKYCTESEEIEEDISPSAIEENSETTIDFSSSGEIKGKLAGQAIHYALSRIGLLNDDNMETTVSDACRFAERKIYSDEEVDEIYMNELISDMRDKILKLISDNDLKNIFYKEDSRQIRLEEQIYYKRTERKNVSGIIDRIVIDENTVKIIDYKWIKDVNDINIKKTIKRYRSQIAYYSDAMGKLYPHKEIKSYLLFIGAPEGKRLVEI